MINLSLLVGYVPQASKVAAIKPLLKKPSPDPAIPANHRPISNPPSLSKIPERAAAKQPTDHLQRNGPPEEVQSGLRTHHSTETAPVKVTNDPPMAPDSGPIPAPVLPDLSAAPDTVDHKILLQRLEHVIGTKGTALRWSESYPSNRPQSVHANGESSPQTKVNHGAPQGSAPGPTPLTPYMPPLGSTTRRHRLNFHCYADDTQLHPSMKPEDTHQPAKLQDRPTDTKTWMTSNLLPPNSDKTEATAPGPTNPRSMVSNQIPTPDGTSPTPSNTARNPGAIPDQDTSLKAHTKQTCRTAPPHPRNISKTRKVPSQSDAEKPIHASTSSRLDHCNSLSGCPKSSPKSPQPIQNAAARALTGTSRREHIPPAPASLHWPPANSRTEFKIPPPTHKVRNNQVPSHPRDPAAPHHPTRAPRSQTAGPPAAPRACKSRMGGRAPSPQAPLLWNQPPTQTRETDTPSTSKTRPKTFPLAKTHS
ncbi:proline-rich receptor-like protein kinase PERK10 [Thalassophryne amazonica]|uniref:proline-rich receptor-like protein kinase PERK10 n=1 Tax=Thalassophryne amazonica TaxID=390379 RepID=UPI0014721BAF|nr:proline-rich receptor-like protein kinase PERK10 [Thalassophryne amazonica]